MSLRETRKEELGLAWLCLKSAGRWRPRGSNSLTDSKLYPLEKRETIVGIWSEGWGRCGHRVVG